MRSYKVCSNKSRVSLWIGQSHYDDKAVKCTEYNRERDHAYKDNEWLPLTQSGTDHVADHAAGLIGPCNKILDAVRSINESQDILVNTYCERCHGRLPPIVW